MGTITYDTREFWEGCQRRELRIARCQDCRTWIHFPRRICPACWSERVEAETVEGIGRLLTYSLPRVGAGAEPIVTAVVTLDAAEGVRLLTRLVDCAPDQVEIGMPLVVDWRDEDGSTLPQFRPS